MENKKEVKTFILDFECPQCKIGKLRPTGTCFTTNPPMFPHKCNLCEYGETFNKQYPIIEYENN